MVRSWEVAADLLPFDARPVLPKERQRLVRLLRGLRDEDWMRPTVCAGWTVHDVALHLLGDDLGRLGRQSASRACMGELDFLDLARRIERSNEDWVAVARRIPPPLVVEFIRVTGREVDRAFAGLDMLAPGVAVAWTGTGPSPWWLDIAREYTERWVHHQQIREAVGQPLLTSRPWLHPVLATFMRSLPLAYDSIAAPPGTRVCVVVDGPAGGRWVLERSDERWRLVPETDSPPMTEVRLDQDLAWRLLTRLVPVDDAVRLVKIRGDRTLGVPATRAIAVMTTNL